MDPMPTLTPNLVVKDSRAAIAFYEAAFGAEVLGVHTDGSGRVINAQLRIGNSVLMLHDEFPEHGLYAPSGNSRLPVSIYIRSHEIEAEYQRALEAGAQVINPLEDMFWGDRFGQFLCPFGHCWCLRQPLSEL